MAHKGGPAPRTPEGGAFWEAALHAGIGGPRRDLGRGGFLAPFSPHNPRVQAVPTPWPDPHRPKDKTPASLARGEPRQEQFRAPSARKEKCRRGDGARRERRARKPRPRELGPPSGGAPRRPRSGSDTVGSLAEHWSVGQPGDRQPTRSLAGLRSPWAPLGAGARAAYGSPGRPRCVHRPGSSSGTPPSLRRTPRSSPASPRRWPSSGRTSRGGGPRVHGSYEHLWAGQVADALVDLTGGLAERWNLKNLASSRSQQDGSGGSEPKTCWQLLSLKERCLISCSVFNPKVPGSWGSFTPSSSRTCVSSGVRLVRVSCCFAFRTPGAGVVGRGPGERGVKGGPRWTQWTRRSCCPSSRKGSSGWMRRSFSVNLTRSPLATRSRRLATCRASTQVLSHTQELPGAWVLGQSAGGCRNNSGFPSNPKFWLRVSEPSEVYIAVLQRPRMRTVDWAGRAQAPVGDSRAVWSPASILGKDYPAVGLHLWKVEKRRVSLPRILSTPPVAGTVCHAYDREVHLRCELTPGYYLAVPSTFLKNVPGQFLLRVFSSGRVSLSAIKTVVQSPGPGETLLAGEWETVQLQGSWKIGQTAGGSRNFASYSSNPCFPLTIPEGAGPRCVRITLHQHCLDSDCHPIGFHVFQNGCEPRGVQKEVLPVPADNGGQGTPSLLLQKPLLSCVPHCYTQEVSRVCHLSAGTYRIVPSTYLPDTEGAFTVTIATRIDRRSIHSQEMLGQLLQEASFMAVMKT
ncbi:calpain-10 isoform X5 [Myotis myotis]|uniref:calpain-10 isoform X5 n=1 Tax=Myotis myotis TaxID=51298 RepID=UPI00174A4D6D|nr:calpain-10 isoform X5 [Myotis myotis]